MYVRFFYFKQKSINDKKIDFAFIVDDICLVDSLIKGVAWNRILLKILLKIDACSKLIDVPLSKNQ